MPHFLAIAILYRRDYAAGGFKMLPVVDRPLIQHVVDEARQAGIEHFIFVTGRNKAVIEDHFDMAYELDLFGHVRRSIEASKADAGAAAGHPLPVVSARYSQMASESQTVRSPWRSTGTRPLGLYFSMSSRVLGVSSVISSSLKGICRCFMRSHGRSDQDE